MRTYIYLLVPARGTRKKDSGLVLNNDTGLEEQLVIIQQFHGQVKNLEEYEVDLFRRPFCSYSMY